MFSKYDGSEPMNCPNDFIGAITNIGFELEVPSDATKRRMKLLRGQHMPRALPSPYLSSQGQMLDRLLHVSTTS